MLPHGLVNKSKKRAREDDDDDDGEQLRDAGREKKARVGQNGGTWMGKGKSVLEAEAEEKENQGGSGTGVRRKLANMRSPAKGKAPGSAKGKGILSLSRLNALARPKGR